MSERINRRRFLKSSLIAGAGGLAALSAEEQILLAEEQKKKKKKYKSKHKLRKVDLSVLHEELQLEYLPVLNQQALQLLL